MSQEVMVNGKKYSLQYGDSLILRNIGLESIEEIEGLEDVAPLEDLDLSNNKITEIKGLENLINLKCLALKNNQLKEIKGLEKLKKLESLDLTCNKIEKGLENLSSLGNLIWLCLENNKIKELHGLEKLRNLKYLHLGLNPLPEDFIEFMGLNNFNKSGIANIEDKQQFKKLKNYIINTKINRNIPNLHLDGKSFHFAGRFKEIDKKLIEENILKAKGRISKSVTKTLDYLIVSDTSVNTEKIQKSKAQGTKILSELDLLLLLGGTSEEDIKNKKINDMLEKKKKEDFFNNLSVGKIPLDRIIKEDLILDSENSIIHDVYMKVKSYKRGETFAHFNIKLHESNGEEIPPIKLSRAKDCDEQIFQKTNKLRLILNKGLKDLITLIQNGGLRYYSNLSMFAQERSIQYNKNEPIHYYLDLILGTPGEKKTIKKGGRKVKACQECNNMLLRYSFNWKIQRDDFKNKDCPYCGKPLKIIERPRRYVKVLLDYEAEDCQIYDTNYQIGIIYNDIPIKITVKVKALFNFLLNYQKLFPNKVIGPLNLSIQIWGTASSDWRTIFYAKSIEPGIMLNEMEWRPAILFPEDLIGF